MIDKAFNRIQAIVETAEILSEFDCLKTIVLNVSEVCNLSCAMCPRAYGYPNAQRFMAVDTAVALAAQLRTYSYRGIVSISGMGEPCFNQELLSICKILKDFNLQLITNGTAGYDVYRQLAKYAHLLVSVHDWRSIGQYQAKFKHMPVLFRNHDLNHPDCELKITNRGGWNDERSRADMCNYPFYKTLIDYDGCYLLCADDWKRVSKRTDINIHNIDIKHYFVNHLRKIKRNMIMKGRLGSEPCSHCDTNGKMIGSNIVAWYEKNVN